MAFPGTNKIYAGFIWLASRPWGFALIAIVQVFIAIIVFKLWGLTGAIVLIFIYCILYFKSKRVLTQAYRDFDQLFNGISAQEIMEILGDLPPEDRKEVIIYLRHRCHSSDIYSEVLKKLNDS